MSKIVLHHNGQDFAASGTPADISIPLRFDGPQPGFFGAESASARPMHAGDFIGDTRLGGSCNADHVDFIPHCNGTHTECVGHLTTERVAVNTLATAPLYVAAVVTVEPVQNPGETATLHAHKPDRLITRAALEPLLGDAPDALVIRTLPNDSDKREREWRSGSTPYFSIDAMDLLVERGVQHLLVDTPSVDRLDDDRLAAHRAFWGLPPGSRSIENASRPQATITELVFVPDEVVDGLYLLDLQIAPFVSDAAPSRPLLHRVSRD
ncbi:MAG: cyclase family protein [Gammaproteobacteria bacterium]|nr:cyclase family protein [Gammaproteobacteria bacterium]